MEVLVEKILLDQYAMLTVNVQQAIMVVDAKIVHILIRLFFKKHEIIRFCFLEYFLCPDLGKYPDLHHFNQGKYFVCNNVHGSKTMRKYFCFYYY